MVSLTITLFIKNAFINAIIQNVWPAWNICEYNMQPIPEIDLSSNIRESDVAHPTDGRRQHSLTDEDFTPRPVASRTDWSTEAARPTVYVGDMSGKWEMGCVAETEYTTFTAQLLIV